MLRPEKYYLLEISRKSLDKTTAKYNDFIRTPMTDEDLTMLFGGTRWPRYRKIIKDTGMFDTRDIVDPSIDEEYAVSQDLDDITLTNNFMTKDEEKKLVYHAIVVAIDELDPRHPRNAKPMKIKVTTNPTLLITNEPTDDGQTSTGVSE